MEISSILKSDYLDIVFEGRNKTYGSYELRKKYPTRARNAAIGTLLVAGILAAVPVLAGIFGDNKSEISITSLKEVKLTDPPPIAPNRPLPPPPPPAPPAPSRPMAHFTPPVIVENEQVREDVKPPDESKHEIAGPENKAGVEGANELNPPSDSREGTAVVETKVKEQVFAYVSQMPTFKDGDVYAWLNSHTRYPDAPRENSIEGKVIVTFVVNETGSISGIEVGRTSGNAALDAEAKRVVASMPAWIPGKNNGTAVKVSFSLPITFQLN